MAGKVPQNARYEKKYYRTKVKSGVRTVKTTVDEPNELIEISSKAL